MVKVGANSSCVYRNGPRIDERRTYEGVRGKSALEVSGVRFPFGKTAREYYEDHYVLGRSKDCENLRKKAQKVWYAERERKTLELLSRGACASALLRAQ